MMWQRLARWLLKQGNWTIVGGAHIPTLRNDVYLPMWGWLDEDAAE